MKRFGILLAALILLGLLGWAPWLTRDRIVQRVEQSFNASWQAVADGCGMNCKGCGVVAAHRSVFGWRVRIEYACGLLPADLPAYHQTAEGFVSFLGAVHGFPKP